MRVLALDTTTPGGSVALVDEGTIVAQRAGDVARTHAERLPRELLDVLEAAQATLASVDLFAVAAGPGSFTGLRIGIAAMQGLAVVTGRRMLGISALDALACAAAEGRPRGAVVGAWIDAHRHEVFSALYRVRDDTSDAFDRLVGVEPPQVDRPGVILQAWLSRPRAEAPAAIAGDGALVYADVIGRSAAVVEPPLLAGIVGRLALARARGGGAVDPAAIRPLYVRRPDAELAREQRSHG